MGDADLWRAKIRNIPDFPKPGVNFKDITPLLADAEAFREVVDTIADAFSGGGIHKVCGIEARGFILAAPVAHRLSAGFVPIRKHGKLPFTSEAASYVLEYAEEVLEIHSDALEPGERVLVVDDVLATGGTARAAAQLISRLNAIVVGFAFLVELGFLGGRGKLEGYRLQSLICY